nr:uncharacterized protein LOC123494217 isoform X1 [Aegilops tauschii subsp. strangulata]
MNAFKMLRQAVPADAAVHAVPPVPSITGNKFSAVRQGVLQGQPPSTCHRTSLVCLVSGEGEGRCAYGVAVQRCRWFQVAGPGEISRQPGVIIFLVTWEYDDVLVTWNMLRFGLQSLIVHACRAAAVAEHKRGSKQANLRGGPGNGSWRGAQGFFFASIDCAIQLV